ncbi:MAG: hypothetical protein ACWGNV_00825 [Bacteroidales bacterium]
MDYTRPDIAIQASSSSSPSYISALRKIFFLDRGLALQTILIPLLAASGIALHFTVIQWSLLVFVTLMFLVAGIFRRAALLQVEQDESYSTFQIVRIKSMGNAIVAVAGGILMLTYLLIYVPRLTQML